MSDARPSDASSGGGRGGILVALLVLASFAVGVVCFARAAQLRVWNGLRPLDVVAMVATTAPFLVARWRLHPRSVLTRIAWWICALLFLDVVALAVGTLAPTGGHPSLEAVIALFAGYAKIVLVPAALLLLAGASLRGERAATALLGSVCLVGETIYTLADPGHPLRLFLPAGQRAA